MVNSSHLSTGSGPDFSYIFKFRLVEHPAVAKLLQTHILCWSRASFTLLEQQLELFLTPGHFCPQSLHRDTAEYFRYTEQVKKAKELDTYTVIQTNMNSSGRGMNGTVSVENPNTPSICCEPLLQVHVQYTCTYRGEHRLPLYKLITSQ